MNKFCQIIKLKHEHVSRHRKSVSSLDMAMVIFSLSSLSLSHVYLNAARISFSIKNGSVTLDQYNSDMYKLFICGIVFSTLLFSIS